MKVSSALRKALVLLRSMLTTVRNIGLAVLLLIGALLGSSAWAHGILMESSPKQNAILHHYPDKVVLRFNASLEPSMTHVVLEDMERNITALHPTKESTIEQIIMTIPPLKPGVYHVRYRVLATDGHLTEGSVRFTLLSP